MSYMLRPKDKHLADHVSRIKKLAFSEQQYLAEYKSLPIIQWLEENVGKIYPMVNQTQVLGQNWRLGITPIIDKSGSTPAVMCVRTVHIVNDIDSKLITEFILRFV